MTESSKAAPANAGPSMPTQAAGPVAPATLGPLVRELQRAGIASGASGPDDGEGRAWIEFRAASSLRDFLNAAVRSGTGAYGRLPWPADPDPSDRRWEIETWVEDQARYKDSGDPDWPDIDRPPELRLTHTLHIPHEDLPGVMAELRGHNRSAGR